MTSGAFQGIDGSIRLTSAQDPACGCIEEEWETPAGFMSVHLTPDGHGDVFFDNGDAGEWEISITAKDRNNFWSQLSLYIKQLPVIDD